MSAAFCMFGAPAVLLALYHGAVWRDREPSMVRTAFKTLPVGLLAVAAFVGGAPLLAVAALALCALGDACLAHDGDSAFLAGLTAFLVGHLAYAAVFGLALEPGMTDGAAFMALAVLTVLSVAAVYGWLWPALGAMRLPVALYCLAIGAMVMLAIGSVWAPLVAIGAALFAASDSVLAWERFKMAAGSPFARLASWFVWHAYFAGQLLMAAAIAA